MSEDEGDKAEADEDGDGDERDMTKGRCVCGGEKKAPVGSDQSRRRAFRFHVPLRLCLCIMLYAQWELGVRLLPSPHVYLHSRRRRRRRRGIRSLLLLSFSCTAPFDLVSFAVFVCV